MTDEHNHHHRKPAPDTRRKGTIEVFWIGTADLSRILYISPSCAILCGHHSEEILQDATHWWNHVLPEDRTSVRQHRQQAVDEKKSIEHSYRILQGDGQRLKVDERLYPFHCAIDQVGHLAALTRIPDDPSTIKEHLELAMWAGDLGTWEWNVLDDQVVGNARWLELYDQQPMPGHLFRQTWKNEMHPQDLAYTDQCMQDHLEGKTELYDVEYRRQARDGGWRWIHARAKVVARDPQGKPTRMVGLDRDITQRKNAEQALAWAHQQLDFHVHNSPLAVIQWDSQFKVSRWSPRAEEIFGWSADEVMGRSPHDWSFIYEDDQEKVGQIVGRLYSGQEPRNACSNRNYRKDNSVIECEWYNSCLQNEAGELVSVLSLVQDITPRVEAERQARRHLDQLARVSRTNTAGEMAAGLAHELNQPLTAIMNFSRGCVRRLETEEGSDPSILDALQQIARQAGRASEIIRWIRKFIGQPPHHPTAVDIQEVLDEVVRLVDYELKQQNIQLFMDRAAYLPRIRCDRMQIEQVLFNLIRNAIESLAAMPPARRRIDIKVNTDTDRWMKIRVRDHGTGLSEEQRLRLFEPFFTTKAGGMGMGMAISKSIVEAHQGTIQAEPTDSGCCICIALPVSLQVG